MNSRKYRKRSIIIVIVVLLLAVIGFILYDFFSNREYQNGGQDVPPQTDRDVIYYDGDAYKYNHNLKNILFLGIDNNAELSEENIPGAGGQADCIIVLSVDRENKTVQAIQISRDSMTEVDIYDANGNAYATLNAQVATQYAYANGAKNGCWATKKTVSELLYEIPIDGYIAMDIAAVSQINDSLGGVTLTIPEDYTMIDSAFEEGTTITLTGEQAEKYVRYRDITIMGDNHFRMRRQIQYIPALLAAMKDKINRSEDALDTLYSEFTPYILTDLTTDEVMNMMQYSWSEENVTFLAGESVAGEKFEEFYIDDIKLQETIIKTFYKLK